MPYFNIHSSSHDSTSLFLFIMEDCLIVVSAHHGLVTDPQR